MSGEFNIHAARRIEARQLAALREASAVQRSEDIHALRRAAAARGGAVSGGLLKEELKLIFAAAETMINTAIANRKELARSAPELLMEQPYLKEFHRVLDEMAAGVEIAVQQLHARPSHAGHFPAAALGAILRDAQGRAKTLRERIDIEIQKMALEGTLARDRETQPHPQVTAFNRASGQTAASPGATKYSDERVRLRVFLCHASNDKRMVRDLYKRLRDEGLQPWLDEEELVPGQDWKSEIQRIVRETHVAVICLSRSSVTKEGFVQKEIKLALDVADEKPERAIFLIPARFEECEVPGRLAGWQWVDLFASNGYDRLLASLRLRRSQLGLDFPDETQAPERPESESRPDLESEQIRRVLAATGGNKSRAAAILGIERKTLYRKLERMKL